MTGLEIQDAMAKIAADYAADADSRVKALPADAKREKKAIIIEREMYNLCSRAGLQRAKITCAGSAAFC